MKSKPVTYFLSEKIKTKMTYERLAEIKARLEAARPKENRGGEELKMTPSKANEKEWHSTVLYADGDGCATIHGNLALDVDTDALAEFFAHALIDVRDMLEEIGRKELKNGKY